MRCKLSTRVFFESAHRLSDYEGKCKQLHGHNWVVDVAVMGKVRKNGFVVDFGKIKEIINQLDHKVLLQDTDENKDMFNKFPEDWIVWFDFNPTCENLADWIRREIKRECKLGLLGYVEVTVYETYKPEKTSSVETK